MMQSIGIAEFIGFTSSFILVLTIGKQVYKQYKEGKSEGVSKWLFIGQMAASFGFLTYSVMKGDSVFILTNALMVLNGFIGLAIVLKHRRAEGNAGSKDVQSETAAGDAADDSGATVRV